MAQNIFIGTPQWHAWTAEIQRTRKLYEKEFLPQRIVLEEKDLLLGILVLSQEVESLEEVGNRALRGQILYWYGDFYQDENAPGNTRPWNAYDAERNVYLVTPAMAEMFTQDQLSYDFESTMRRLEALGSQITPA